MIPILNNPHDSLTPEEISSFKKYLTIENFISDHECDKLIELGEQSVVSAVKKHTFTNIMQMDHCFLPKDDPIHSVLMPAWEQALSYFNIDVDFIEPYNDEYVKAKVLIKPEDLQIVRNQIKETFENIKKHRFDGCGKEDCNWCTFVRNNFQAPDTLLELAGADENSID